MSIRRIAFLTPLYFSEESCLGGGERYPLNLALGVARASGGAIEVDLISYGRKAFRKSLGPGVTLRVLPASNRPRNPLDSVSWEVAEAIEGADLVHVHMVFTRSNESAILAAKILGKPVVMTDHGGMSSTIGLEVGSLELADHIVAYSRFGASLYQTTRPITIVKGGVDGSLFTPPPPGERPRRDRVLYVGRILPHKGIDVLIDALPPELPLTICGRPYHEVYYRHLQEISTRKQVEFVTDADDARIVDLYRRAWVNVLPSVYRDRYGSTHGAPELMGFTLLEAMACGTPAICSNVAAMPEFVRHGETGFVFQSRDELTDQLRRLAAEPDLVERMGLAARRAIDDEFDLSVAGQALVKVYQAVTSRARGAAA